jgi:hypothetical protein
MKTKKKKAAKKKTYHVYRYWTVEMKSIASVEASSVEEACRLAMEDDDYSDAEICDGSDGPTEIGMIECDGDELEVPENF